MNVSKNAEIKVAIREKTLGNLFQLTKWSIAKNGGMLATWLPHTQVIIFPERRKASINIKLEKKHRLANGF